MKTWAVNVWLAVYALGRQFVLWMNQGCNVVICGLLAVVMAIFTGSQQAVAYADETMSAHAWRAHKRKRRMGHIFMPLIDLIFFWQGQDEKVNERAGFPIAGHCERAYWKELLRHEMPPAYRDPIPNTKDAT